MSEARECDKCGELFKPSKGCVNVEQVHVVTGENTKDGTPLESGWSEIDLCLTCSRPVIEALDGAADGMKAYLPRKGKKR